jgi:hypothetical protein
VGTTEVASADLIATSSSSNLLVAWADKDTAGEDTCEEIDGATDYFAKSDSLADTSEHTAGEGDYVLCVAAKEDDSSANATITIQARAGDSTGSYVTVETVSVLVLGPTASLALSISGGYKYIANENTELADWITVIGRDAAGNVLNGGDGSVTEGEDLADIANWDSNPDNAQEDQIVFLHDSAEAADADGAMSTKTCATRVTVTKFLATKASHTLSRWKMPRRDSSSPTESRSPVRSIQAKLWSLGSPPLHHPAHRFGTMAQVMTARSSIQQP